MDTKTLLERYGLTERGLDRVLVAKQKKPSKPLHLQLQGGDTYTFGAMGDTHLCSTHEQLDELATYYELARKRGVTTIYHAGDILEGMGVYKGQEFEIHTFGADNQADYVVKNYPKIKGIETFFVGGNHDYSFYRLSGVDIGEQIASKRPDLHYLGMFQNDVYWRGIRLIRLIHPDGGMPYALTYRAQTILTRGMISGQKPKVLLLGHLHTVYSFTSRNVQVFGVGCFSGQSNLLLRMGIEPVLGGWFITLKLGKDKMHSVVSVVSEFVPFYLNKD